MDKKTLTLIGVAGLGLAALYIWSKSKQKNFANLKGGPNPQPLGYSQNPATGQYTFYGGPRGTLLLPLGSSAPEFFNNQWITIAPDGLLYYLTGPSAASQNTLSQAY